jgi:hypothetical protein
MIGKKRKGLEIARLLKDVQTAHALHFHGFADRVVRAA